MSEVTFPFQTIRDVDVNGKTILMRADYNVPLNNDGSIADDFRITASVPTIKYLLERGARLAVVSHMGRPKGQVNDKYSLRHVAERLAEILGQPVGFVPDCIGYQVAEVMQNVASGQVILLENLRFYPGEEQNDIDFASQLIDAVGAELFVQDGFGVVHRPHASTDAVARLLPAVAGLLLEREYVALKTATESPRRPLTAVIGGAKISDKMPLVKKFLATADRVIVGGALANNFIKYDGHDVGGSLVEDGVDGLVDNVQTMAHQKFGADLSGCFVTPIDVAYSSDGTLDGAERHECGLDELPAGAVIYDAGQQTIDAIRPIIESSGTVIWNGTLGMAEYPQFATASAALAEVLASSSEIASIIGGGDTADFVRKWDSRGGASFTHVSTGGGASLELMSGDDLPGIEVLMRK